MDSQKSSDATVAQQAAVSERSKESEMNELGGREVPPMESVSVDTGLLGTAESAQEKETGQSGNMDQYREQKESVVEKQPMQVHSQLKTNDVAENSMNLSKHDAIDAGGKLQEVEGEIPKERRESSSNLEAVSDVNTEDRTDEGKLARSERQDNVVSVEGEQKHEQDSSTEASVDKATSKFPNPQPTKCVPVTNDVDGSGTDVIYDKTDFHGVETMEQLHVVDVVVQEIPRSVEAAQNSDLALNNPTESTTARSLKHGIEENGSSRPKSRRKRRSKRKSTSDNGDTTETEDEAAKDPERSRTKAKTSKTSQSDSQSLAREGENLKKVLKKKIVPRTVSASAPPKQIIRRAARGKTGPSQAVQPRNNSANPKRAAARSGAKRKPRIEDVYAFEGETENMTIADILADLKLREIRLSELERLKAQEKPTKEQVALREQSERAQRMATEPVVTSTAEQEPCQENSNDEEAEEDDDGAVVAPQVQIGSDGKIIINEESLMVTTGQEFDVNPAQTIEIDPNAYVNSNTYLKKEQSLRWSRRETELFFIGLRQFGTDFGMMEHLIPGRTRRQIKLKFVRETKTNGHLVDEALSNRISLDVEAFSHYERVYREIHPEADKQRKKEVKPTDKELEEPEQSGEDYLKDVVAGVEGKDTEKAINYELEKEVSGAS